MTLDTVAAGLLALLLAALLSAVLGWALVCFLRSVGGFSRDESDEDAARIRQALWRLQQEQERRAHARHSRYVRDLGGDDDAAA